MTQDAEFDDGDAERVSRLLANTKATFAALADRPRFDAEPADLAKAMSRLAPAAASGAGAGLTPAPTTGKARRDDLAGRALPLRCGGAHPLPRALLPRGHRRLRRAHRPPRRRPRLLHPLRPRRGPRPGRRGGPRPRGRRPDRPAPRRPPRPQGHVLPRGRGVHLRLEDPAGLRPRPDRHRAPAARRGGRARRRRPQPLRVRARPDRPQRALRGVPQSLEPRAHLGRVVERLGGLGGGPPRLRRARLGHRRVGPPAGRRQRPRRRQADPDPGEPLRDDGPLVLARQRGAAHPHRARRGPPPRGHRRTRPGGPDEQPPPRTGLRGRGPRPRRPPRASRRRAAELLLRYGGPGSEGAARRLAPGARGPRGGDRRGHRAPPRARRAPPARGPDLGGRGPARGLARGPRRRLRAAGAGADPARARCPGRLVPAGAPAPAAHRRRLRGAGVRRVRRPPPAGVPDPGSDHRGDRRRGVARVHPDHRRHRTLHAPDQLPHLPLHRDAGPASPAMGCPARSSSREGPSTRRPCSGAAAAYEAATGFPARAPDLQPRT